MFADGAGSTRATAAVDVGLAAVLPVVGALGGVAGSEMPSQAFVLQSLSTSHLSPTGQAGQTPPPQSTSVSAPSLWCRRTGWRRTVRWLVTSPRRCSRCPPGTLPTAHAGQVPPPQSTSVSLPFLMPSLHWLAGARPAGVERRDGAVACSPGSPCRRRRPGQVPPPQSTSVSLPSLTVRPRTGGLGRCCRRSRWSAVRTYRASPRRTRRRCRRRSRRRSRCHFEFRPCR